MCYSSSIQLYFIPYFIMPPPAFLCAAIYRFMWYSTYNTPCLTVIPLYIYLVTKIYGLLTKQG